jgi:hypothetical protein
MRRFRGPYHRQDFNVKRMSAHFESVCKKSPVPIVNSDLFEMM